MTKRKRIFILIIISLVILGTLWCYRESLLIKYYQRQGLYFDMSVDIIPGYIHLPVKYLKELQDEKIKDICNLVSITNENFEIENKKVSKVLIKIINDSDTEVTFYQLEGNYYKEVGTNYNYIGSIFKNIIRDKKKSFIGIEVFDKNLKVSLKYDLIKGEIADSLFIIKTVVKH